MKLIEKNKKAFFDYEFEEKIEAGIVLAGSEVKSVKMGNISLRDAFCHAEKGEIFLKNCYIAPYEKGSAFNEDPRRNRKLLLHKCEISRLIGKIKTKGFTLIPTAAYFLNNRVKIEIALGRGKKQHDKRDAIRERELKIEAERAMLER